jgi:hypothetical protein
MSFAPIKGQRGNTLCIDSRYYSSVLQQIEDGTFHFRPLLPTDGITRWDGVRIMFKTEYPETHRFYVTVVCNSQSILQHGEKVKIQRSWTLEFENEINFATPQVRTFTMHPNRIEWRNPSQPLFGAFDWQTTMSDYTNYRIEHPLAPVFLNCGPHTYECKVRREARLPGTGHASVEFYCPAERKSMLVYLLQ